MYTLYSMFPYWFMELKTSFQVSTLRSHWEMICPKIYKSTVISKHKKRYIPPFNKMKILLLNENKADSKIGLPMKEHRTFGQVSSV